MTTFTLTIRCDNAAFEPSPEAELTRILHEWADKIESGEWIEKYRTVRDANGNDVGRIKLERE